MTLASIQKIAALLLSIFPLNAQLPVMVMCGSPTDQYFVGTSQPQATCTPGVPNETCTYIDTAMPAPWQNLRFGTLIHYRIPIQAGVYVGFLHFVEPNKTAAGQRSFTVTIQGETSPPLDVFALAGGKDIHYAMPFLCVAQIGTCDVQLTAITGNAIISEIDLAGAPLTASLGPPLGPIRLFQQQLGEPVIFAAFRNGSIQ